MYSPKISEDLVPLLYQIRKTLGKPMTAVVDDFLRPQVMVAHAVLHQITERSHDHERHTQGNRIHQAEA